MRRFARHFAADVPRHMTAVFVVTSILGLIQVGFRCARWWNDPDDAPRIVSKAVEELATQLDVAWIFVCTVGLCSAMAHWSRRGQDRIVSWSGIPFRRVVGPGFLLCLLVLITGTVGIDRLLPDVDTNRIAWSDGATWGAALRRHEEPWEWVEIRATESGTSLHRGRAESRATLPEPARDLDVGSERLGRSAGLRVAFLFLICGLMLRAMRLEPRRVTAFAFIAPVLGWILWEKVVSTAGTLLGASLPAMLLALGVAAVGIASLGLLVIHRARD